MIPNAYRTLLRDQPAPRLLSGLGISSLGDGMSTVTIAWFAVRIAPAGELGLFVGPALAAYSLPSAIGVLALGRYLRGRAARTLVLAHTALPAGFLAAIAALASCGLLSPPAYIVLLAGSSVLASWGSAGQYTMLADLGGAQGHLAANSLASAQVWLATIIDRRWPAYSSCGSRPLGCWRSTLPGSPSSGLQAWRAHSPGPTTTEPIDTSAVESGFKLFRRHGLVGLIILTWLFFFLYGPVEDALPVYVAHDLHAHARLLGLYWTSFGIGALASTLLTGALRGRATRRVVLLIVLGWGACLVPFALAPVDVTIVCFAFGGLVYGPFVPLTYALFQSLATTATLPSVLAARSAALAVASPLGTAVGGPIVVALGADWTLTASGIATVLLAVVAAPLWRSTRGGKPAGVPEQLAPWG